MDGERRLFESRRGQREAQIAQLNERIGQHRREIEGLTVQHAAKGDELDLIRQEEARVTGLYT